MKQAESASRDAKLLIHLVKAEKEAAMKQAESARRAAELITHLVKAEKEAAMKQAESASRAAESLMKGGGDASEDSVEGKKMKEQIAKV